MKRQQFHITSTQGHDIIKNAWNSSIRAIEKLAGELAKEAGADFHLTASESVKDGLPTPVGSHVQGSRTWTNAKNGLAVVFTIKKL